MLGIIGRDALKAGGDRGGVEPAEAVALTPRQDRGQDFIELCCGQYEHKVRRRLLQDLQQRIKGRFGEHVHLVDDIHALADRCGREYRLVAQHTHIVHAVVGSRVQLHHIQNRAVLDPPAGGALVAGIAVDRMLAVDCLGQDPRAGGLTGAAGADEQIRVAQPPGAHLIFQCLGDRLLPYDVVERFGPVFAV